jgi:hypothetical protein
VDLVDAQPLGYRLGGGESVAGGHHDSDAKTVKL